MTIPATTYVPGPYVDFATPQPAAAVEVLPQSVLLIGQMLSTGTATAGLVRRVTSADEVAVLCGRGSMLHEMSRHAYGTVPSGLDVYILPLGDASGATASETDIAFSGASTEAGELALYIAGARYSVPVADGDVPSDVAAAAVAAVNADPNALVSASAAAGVVTLTARNKGVAAGRLPVIINRYVGEDVPAGITVAIGARTEGTVDPDLTSALAGLGPKHYPTMVSPYTGGANLAAMRAAVDERWGPTVQLDSAVFAALRLADAQAMSAAAAAQNYPYLIMLDARNSWSADYAIAVPAAMLWAVEPDVGRPIQDLPLPTLLSVAEPDALSWNERNTLISAGISSTKVDAGGVVRVERLTTTYRLNGYGTRDDSYFDAETVALLQNERYSLRARFAAKYPRHKLGQDGSIGANVMTPTLAKSELISLYLAWMDLGWVEGGTALEQFKRDVVANISLSDPSRLDVLLKPDEISPFRVLAATIQFQR